MERASTSSYFASAALTAVGAMTVQEWAALFGIIFAVATFAVNWIYRHREDSRQEKMFRHYLHHKQSSPKVPDNSELNQRP